MQGGQLIVAQREMGETLPLSIPTANALVGLDSYEIKKETNLYVNIRTLFRNLVGSVDPVKRPSILAEDFLPTLINEIEFIAEHIPKTHNGLLSVAFYHNDYADLSRKLPKAIPKQANTVKQRETMARELGAMKMLLGMLDKEGCIHGINILQGKTHISTKGNEGILLTHSPIDLLFTDFRRLVLLESHTGAIKGKKDWYTKLTNGRDMPNMPFNKFTVTIFGDNNTYLSMNDRKLREVVVDMAGKNNWHSLSTKDRIVSSINGLRDPLARMLLLKYLRS